MIKLNKNEGITLIALVITIIVLLILAGISIATLTGENGLLSKATTAKEETKKAEIREEIELAIIAIQAEELSKGNKVTFHTYRIGNHNNCIIDFSRNKHCNFNRRKWITF